MNDDSGQENMQQPVSSYTGDFKAVVDQKVEKSCVEPIPKGG